MDIEPADNHMRKIHLSKRVIPIKSIPISFSALKINTLTLELIHWLLETC